MIFSKTDAMIDELPLLGRVIYVDPGHGITHHAKKTIIFSNPVYLKTNLKTFL